MREAGLLLDKITSVNLSKPRKNAEHALKKAREQLVGLQDMLSSGDLEDASDAIQERLRDIVARLMDLEKHARAANEALDQTSRMNKYNSAARDTTSELIPRIEDLAQTEKETALERNRLNKDGQELLQEARDNFEELSRLVMEVSKVSQMVEHREGILARLNPLYKRQYVTPAAEHAAELMRQARLYNE
ncbi:hypothetical protein B566_EDAN013951 [Ephemera danica]|nr:hypothetical protein B566_EDAN013951 [Ephemera danica]